jgi:pimeloyl-ACP methyl ester carboxylesterase
MQTPKTAYARSGDLHIAYQVVGDGSTDVALVDQWFSQMEAQWDVPPLASFLHRLAAFSRLVVFDKRGTGLSDPVAVSALPSLEQWMDDLRAVLDDVGIERAALVGGVAGALMVMLFAATYPERTKALVLVDPFARMPQAPDYPIGFAPEEVTRRVERFTGWGQGALLDVMAPSAAADHGFRELWARYERQSTSPAAAYAMVRMMYQADLREVLPAIRVPTLVIHRREATRIPPRLGRYIADRIPGARFVEVPGVDDFMWAGDQDAVIEEIQEFLTGVRPRPEPDRVLATILFTDIIGSTERAAELGDRRWRDLLARHHALLRDHIQRARGREIDTAGDGFLATFDGPARGIMCAGEIARDVRDLGIAIRAGMHTGEIELMGDDIGGIAVHITARIMAMAGSGEVLVSSTVKDLVTGSDFKFEDRGAHILRGVPGEWRLFAAASK